jgi:pimeloyl-ACP methyl ester carboxylesterase
LSVALPKASDGIELYAECHGSAGGLPVVFSCAYSTTRENWRPQVAPLVAAGYRVVLWDYRGHGRSQVPERPGAYSMQQVVDDLARVIDWAVPGERVVLAGLSFGGLVSLHYTLLRPTRVLALVLAGSGPGFKNPQAAADWQRRSERTADYIEEKGLEVFVRGKAAATCIGRRPELPAAQAAARAIAAQDARGVGLFGRHVAGLAPPVIDELGRIDCPALVVVGAEDEPYLRAAEVMAARLPNARHLVIPGAGHIVNIEAEDAFNRLLLDFLAELVRAGSRVGTGP